MPMKTRLLDLMRRARSDEQAFLDALDPDERQAVGSLDRWSARDMVAHNMEWRARLAERLAAARRGEVTEEVQDFLLLNDEMFELHAHDLWPDLLASVEQSYEVITREVEALTEEQLLDPQYAPGLNGQAVWRRVAGTCFSHPLSHYAQYYVERGQPVRAIELQERGTQTLLALEDSPGWRAVNVYNLACVYALAGRAGQAIDHLREAFRLNPPLAEWARQDTDLVSLRGAPDFQALYAGG